MAWVKKQTATGTDTTFASSVNATFGSALTNPSIILLAIEVDTGAQNSANTPTDTAGNTYVRVLSTSLSATFDLEIWYALNTHTTASNKVTVTDSAGGADGILIVEEWTGNVTSSPVDQSQSSSDNSGATTPTSTATPSTTDANDLIWGAAVGSNGANDMSLGAGYSNLTQTHTSFSNLAIESKTVAATGTQTATFGMSPLGSWVCGVVCIKGPVAGTFNEDFMPIPQPVMAAYAQIVSV